MKIQSILVPSKDICKENELYFHNNQKWQLFNGYFNLFYIEKHKEYTFIESLSLIVTLKGYSWIRLMHDKEVLVERKLDENNFVTYTFEFPYADYTKGVFWFSLKKANENVEKKIEGYYDARANKKKDVRLAVNICTYRREKYVLKNMTKIASFIEREPDIVRNMQIYLIDNGQTLSTSTELKNLIKKVQIIRIIPNDNTGGCGGFTRGMKEVIAKNKWITNVSRSSIERPFTHIVMMDDDACFDPDTFVRLFGILHFIKDKYAKAAVGGALWREDYPYLQHACGESFERFRIINKHLLTDLRDYNQCTSDWMCEVGHENECYGAWWCCTYPMSEVTEDKLPLPVFVHHDDIQFGLRRKKNGVLFLNGIGVWHQGFELCFPGVKQYYNMRNTLITEALYEPKVKSFEVALWASKRTLGLLLMCRYAEMEFVYKGIKDFLKGPEWISKLDSATYHRRLSDYYKKNFPLQDIEELELDVRNKDELVKEINNFHQNLSISQLRNYYNKKKYKTTFFKKLTINGWLFWADKNCGIMTPLDNPWKIYRKKEILMYEISSRKACFVRRDYRKLLRMIKIVILIFCDIMKNYKKVSGDYHSEVLIKKS